MMAPSAPAVHSSMRLNIVTMHCNARWQVGALTLLRRPLVAAFGAPEATSDILMKLLLYVAAFLLADGMQARPRASSPFLGLHPHHPSSPSLLTLPPHPPFLTLPPTDAMKMCLTGIITGAGKQGVTGPILVIRALLPLAALLMATLITTDDQTNHHLPS